LVFFGGFISFREQQKGHLARKTLEHPLMLKGHSMPTQPNVELEIF